MCLSPKGSIVEFIFGKGRALNSIWELWFSEMIEVYLFWLSCSPKEHLGRSCYCITCIKPLIRFQHYTVILKTDQKYLEVPYMEGQLWLSADRMVISFSKLFAVRWYSLLQKWSQRKCDWKFHTKSIINLSWVASFKWLNWMFASWIFSESELSCRYLARYCLFFPSSMVFASRVAFHAEKLFGKWKIQIIVMPWFLFLPLLPEIAVLAQTWFCKNLSKD